MISVFACFKTCLPTFTILSLIYRSYTSSFTTNAINTNVFRNFVIHTESFNLDVKSVPIFLGENKNPPREVCSRRRSATDCRLGNSDDPTLTTLPIYMTNHKWSSPPLSATHFVVLYTTMMNIKGCLVILVKR